MPLYEYLCDSCGHRFERIQKFSDPPVTECPNCGHAVRKLLSSPAIQFKGSGWYITDYAKSGSGDKAGSSNADKGQAAAGTNTDKTEGGGSAAAAPASTESTPTAAKPSGGAS